MFQFLVGIYIKKSLGNYIFQITRKDKGESDIQIEASFFF